MIAQVEGVWCGQIFRERGREREICWVLSARVCDGGRPTDCASAAAEALRKVSK